MSTKELPGMAEHVSLLLSTNYGQWFQPENTYIVKETSLYSLAAV